MSNTSVVLSHTLTANALDFLVFREAPNALSWNCMASLTIRMSAGAVTRSVTSAWATTVVLCFHHPIRMPGSFCSSILSKGIRHSAKSNMLIGHPRRTEHCVEIRPDSCPCTWMDDTAFSYMRVTRSMSVH